jgi:hypothetical protein
MRSLYPASPEHPEQLTISLLFQYLGVFRIDLAIQNVPEHARYPERYPERWK